MVNRDEANELSQLRRLLPHYRSEHHAYDELLAADTGHLKSWLRLLAGGEDHVFLATGNELPGFCIGAVVEGAGVLGVEMKKAPETWRHFN